ncbi:MAG: hypothetical protein ACREPD_04770 [Stenotrophomonas sp.]|uniref:hypothetical protein n=1 Tax=Stenotrophomonas sp. TaxID=69392 RepID=UPI003D6C7749
MSVENLNVLAQAAIAKALQKGVVLDSRSLADLVMAQGYRYRPYVQGLINRAYLAGMLVRIGSDTPKKYCLASDWKIDESSLLVAQQHGGHSPGRVIRQTPADSAAKAVLAHHPLAYEGPAFDKESLAPSLGTVCMSQEELEGELPPWLGHRIVDSLHAHFDRIFDDAE